MSTTDCSKITMDGKHLTLKIWPSSKIHYAYLDNNYVYRNGSLGNSCMRHKANQRSLNFYVKNKVKIVVAVDDKNKIYGRALLWQDIHKIGIKKTYTYLDRRYLVSSHLDTYFRTLAAENNWIYYEGDCAGSADKFWYITNINLEGVCHLPYTDTFLHLYYKDRVITSGSSYSRFGIIKNPRDYVRLTVTNNGGYFPQLDPNKITEAFTGLFQSKKDCIYIKRYKGYVAKENIADINGDYYSTYDDKIGSLADGKWALKENIVEEVITTAPIDKTTAIYSDYYDGYIRPEKILYVLINSGITFQAVSSIKKSKWMKKGTFM
jgi:hypothetical protein